MSNLNLKGIWIPIEILTDKQLSDKEKIIYAIVICLSKENGYCFLTNKTISQFGVRIDIWTHLMRGCIIKLCTPI